METMYGVPLDDSTMRRPRVNGIRVLGLVLTLLIVLSGVLFGLASTQSYFQYLAILTAIVAVMTLMLFVCRMATDKDSCLSVICAKSSCCKGQNTTCCGTVICCLQRPQSTQPADWCETRRSVLTGPQAHLDTEVIRELRKTESHLLGLLFILEQLRTTENTSGSREDIELLDLLNWYVKTEYTVLSSWVEGRTPCTGEDVQRMRSRLGFMCSQGPLAINTGPQSTSCTSTVDQSYEQWLEITRRWLYTLRMSTSHALNQSQPLNIGQGFTGGYVNDTYVLETPTNSMDISMCSVNSTHTDDFSSYILMEPPPYQEVDPQSVPNTPISHLPTSGPLFPSVPLATVSSPALASSPAGPPGQPPPYAALTLSSLSPIVTTRGTLSAQLESDETVDAPPPYEENDPAVENSAV